MGKMIGGRTETASVQAKAYNPYKALSNGAGSKVRNGVSQIHERFVAMGFNPVLSTELVQANENVYNRGLDEYGQDNGKSNFFVRVSARGNRISVFFFNPDFGPGADQLTPRQIYHWHKVRWFSDGWADAVTADVSATARLKPENSYLTVFHFHVGCIDGVKLLDRHCDDGRSDFVSIGQQMMEHHIDLAYPTMHNNFVPKYYERMAEIGRGAGIVILPGVELTVPMSGDNGPHELLWFASPEVARKYHQDILKRRKGKYPPYAPDRSTQYVMDYNREMVKKHKMAIGIAHPAANGIISWLGRVAMGEWKRTDLEKHIREDVQAVGAFNTDISSFRRIKSANPSEQAYFENLVKDMDIGNQPRLNAVNMAFAKKVNKQYGKAGTADHDIHTFRKPKNNHSVQPLGKMLNVVHFDGPRTQKPVPGEMVEMLLSPQVKDRIEAFIPFDKKNGNLVSNRLYLTFADHIIQAFELVPRVLEAAPAILKDVGDILRTAWADVKERIWALYN